STGQVRAKKSNADHDTQWVNVSGGGSGESNRIHQLDSSLTISDDDVDEAVVNLVMNNSQVLEATKEKMTVTGPASGWVVTIAHPDEDLSFYSSSVTAHTNGDVFATGYFDTENGGY